MNNNLPKDDYTYIGDVPLGVSRAKNQKAALLRAKDPNAGKLILFVVGGITRGEAYRL